MSKAARPFRIGIVAGEASGDQLGAALIKALQSLVDRPLHIEGIGGDAMQAAGCRCLDHIRQLSVMGLWEPLWRLPALWRLRQRLVQHFLQDPPDLFIGIDAPDFNLGLEKKLRQAGIRVVHYVGPSIWAWRSQRIHTIKRAVDLVLVLFPFEESLYHRYNVPVCYVGHPLADCIPLKIEKKDAYAALSLPPATYVALLPGSRPQDLYYHAIPMILAAKQAWHRSPDLWFITSHLTSQHSQAFYALWQQHAVEVPLTCFVDCMHTVIAAAEVVIVKSGTASLEAMLFKKPMVIVYRTAWLTYYIAKWLVKVPSVGLPNLLAGTTLVPELLQHHAQPSRIAELLLYYVRRPDVKQFLHCSFTHLHQTLRVQAAQRAAEAIVALGRVKRCSSVS